MADKERLIKALCTWLDVSRYTAEKVASAIEEFVDDSVEQHRTNEPHHYKDGSTY